MIGRRHEQKRFDHWVYSGRPELIVVHGRRRIGKTYFVTSYFRDRFAFEVTGVAKSPMRTQLRVFHQKLLEYGGTWLKAPQDWFEAFSRLKELLDSGEVPRDVGSGRRVVFIDEMPWFDTPRASFKQAFEFFWNDWASKQNDLLLIVCGSSTSWLFENLLRNTVGFYGRVTGVINLQPFTLRESEELLRFNGIEWTRPQVMELCLVFGGVPYYLNLVRRGLSVSQAVEELCFVAGGPLEHELGLLFHSLFQNAENYLAVVRALSRHASGLADTELRQMDGLPTGASLTRAVKRLELSGFVRKVQEYPARERGARYVLADPFTLFALTFLEKRTFDSWQAHATTPAYATWRGLAFERLCFTHVPQIKASLGISGIESRVCSWQGQIEGRSAQIDMLIDRKDGIIDICEMKFTDARFELDRTGYEAFVRRREIFREATGVVSALHLVLVSANGVVRGSYALNLQAIIDGEQLFE